MLSVRNLVKRYKPKKGVAVTAIDCISLDFPDKGMVFLLGKSGSGKSTLLNLLGGLDRYDDGEIIIKGVSSKKFKQCHFDSYRNTYVGFIFQEYNILEEFSVGANIALAIELQGRKCTDNEINDILHKVDLDGYGNRKPNELSGGQKQRVAIARALVKNPEIIMADEPTGALDSNTGRQVLETLKKLSTDKLVIVVSHDREFAERYADRIIELADGKVINDIESDGGELEMSADSLVFFDNTVTVPAKYRLTEDDLKAINEYMESLDKGIVFKISEKKHGFKLTDTEKIRTDSDASGFKLIKSKLPLKNAFKIGVSGLKYKKFRLVLTIFLSVISFTLFGVADTFGSYNHINACTNSLIDSEIKYASMRKEKQYGKGTSAYWNGYGYFFDDEDVKNVSEDTGHSFKGVYSPEEISLGFSQHFDTSIELSKTDYSVNTERFAGFMDITEADLKDFNCTLVAGSLPNGSKNELAISTYVFDTFKKAGYIAANVDEKPDASKKITISAYDDMVGKTLLIGDISFTVSGIIDTGFDFERYGSLTEEKLGQTTADQLVDYLLYNELTYETEYGISKVAFVGEGKTRALSEHFPNVSYINNVSITLKAENQYFRVSRISRLSEIDGSIVNWVTEPKTELAANEFIVTADKIDIINSDGFNTKTGDAFDFVIPEMGYEDNPSGVSTTFDEISKTDFQLSYDNYTEDEFYTEEGWKLVGFVDFDQMEKSGYSNCVFVSDEFYERCVGDKDGIYKYITTAMPTERSEVRQLVDYSYTPTDKIRMPLQSAVTYELDTVNDALKLLSTVFLYIGLGFALFSSLMLSNFIATSISHKKRDIGVLRAIGSRSNDVFRIFFSESFVIAAVNFVLSSVGTFVVTKIVNKVLRDEAGVLITVLSFGIRQLLLIFAVSVFVAVAASFLPVNRIASKRPVDAIRNR